MRGREPIKEDDVAFYPSDVMSEYFKINRVEYHMIHKWMIRYFGKATCCQNKHCDNISESYQWAKKKGEEYAYCRESFIMLCARCHYYYDEKFKKEKKPRQYKKDRLNESRN
jgi:hypothetical protein